MATRVKLPPGFVLDEETQAPSSAAPQGINLPAGFVLDGSRADVRIEGPRNPMTGARPQYAREDLARKFIPQATRGLYDSLPGAKNLLALLQPEAADFQARIPAPEGAMGTIGRVTGEIAPDLALMTPFTKAAAALPMAPGLSNLAKLANNPLARTSLGVGAYEGTKSAVQGQGPQEAAKRAGLGAGTAIIGGKAAEVGGKAIQGGLKALGAAPGKVVNSLIKPLLKDFSYGKDPGRTVAAEGIVGNDFDDLLLNISKRRAEVGQEIGAVLARPVNAVKTIDMSGFLKPLQDAIAEAKKYPKVNAALVSRLDDTMNDIVARIKTGGQIALGDAAALKSEIGAITKWTGNASDDQLVNSALKKSYGFLKEKIGQAVPEVKALNERFANLLSAEIATRYRDKIVSRQNLLSLTPKILGGGAAIAGLATGNPKLIAAALVEIGTEKIMSSPAMKTRIARSLAKLPADKLAEVLENSPELKKLPGIAAKVTAATALRRRKEEK